MSSSFELQVNRLREEYEAPSLSQDDLRADPVEQFYHWFQEAKEAESKLPDAMSLATASRAGEPSVRTVVLRGFNGTGFVFYTDLQSPKSQDLQVNSRAALLFFWKSLHRQVRIRGNVREISRSQVEDYFHSRPYHSQLASFISKQSQKIPSREQLEDQFQQAKQKYPDEVPVPEDWGGFSVIPDRMEFWQGRVSRLHDRFLYDRSGEGSEWSISRISP